MLKSPIAYLNSNDGSSLIAFGEGKLSIVTGSNTLKTIDNFIESNKGEFIFCAFSYDLKNEIEDLSSSNYDGVSFPESILWVPECIAEVTNDKLVFIKGSSTPENLDFVHTFLKKQETINDIDFNHQLKPRTSKENYLKHVNHLKEEIQQGNIYEVNYCQEYYKEKAALTDPFGVYFKWNNITKAPYSVFFDIDDYILISGSPERYIHKKKQTLVSSPIKGTSKRGATLEEDEKLKQTLYNDPKERSENIMIVDLVRNDLSKIALKNSVKVDELCGIHTFNTVHQMISTVSCKIDKETAFIDILKATFPMGSMTGAPKVNAMKLIEKHEDFKRGLYAGTVGLITPSGDFDFNVIIRSLLYNKRKKYLSCSVGGAITIKSSAEKEFEECNVKVSGTLQKMNA